MTDVTPPSPPELRRPRRLPVLLVVLALAVAGVGAYLLWPPATLDGEAAVEAALPTEDDLPGYVEHDGLTGALSPPAGHESGRTVLTGDDLTAQCRTYDAEQDGWACADVQGLGWVLLQHSSSRYFWLFSTVLAYPDEDAAEAAYHGLVADIRQQLPSYHTERVSGHGDTDRRFEVEGFTSFAILVGTVVVEASVWDGTDHLVEAGEAAERAMTEKWPVLQLDRIEAALG